MKLHEEVELLKKVIRIINNTADLSDLLKKVAELIIQFVPGNSCLVYLLDQSREHLVLRGSYNPHPKLLGHIRLKIGEGITGWVAREKETAAISKNASDDPRFKPFSSLPEDRYEAFLSVPILKKTTLSADKSSDLIGVINIQHKTPHPYSKREISLVETIADLVVGVIEKTRLMEELSFAQETIQTRKLIERAKGILMQKHQMTEADAFKTIQIQSRNARKTMKEIAESVIMVENIKKK